jgi:hypothetical protein
MIRIPFSDDREVISKADVIYSNPGRGVGVRFQGLTEEAQAILERELEHG